MGDADVERAVKATALGLVLVVVALALYGLWARGEMHSLRGEVDQLRETTVPVSPITNEDSIVGLAREIVQLRSDVEAIDQHQTARCLALLDLIGEEDNYRERNACRRAA